MKLKKKLRDKNWLNLSLACAIDQSLIFARKRVLVLV
jgi:hypothetical protein